MKIQIIGLGPGNFDDLTLRAYNLLQDETHLILRTAKHPLVNEFSLRGIEYTSCDKFYVTAMNFDEVYENITEYIISKAREHQVVQYAVPGNPLVLESTVDRLIEKAREEDIEIEIISSVSALEAISASLKVSQAKGLIVLDALDMPEKEFYVGQELIITQTFNKLIASDLKLHLLDLYPAETNVIIIQAAGITDQEKIIKTQLAELDWHDFNHLTSVYVPKTNVSDSFYDLIKIVRDLRSPSGCPWDKEQSHESLQTALLEEAYEVLEAIQLGDMNGLCEELGDLLLQIAFHAVLADEAGYFNYKDVVNSIVKKMIRRHPHVFGDTKASTSKEVLKNWEQIKLEEKEEINPSMMDNIPSTLPALLQADKIQRRAARVGFDWDNIDDVWAKVEEEINELKSAEKTEHLDELGDVLFAVVNLARFINVDAESALISTIRKFKKRFRYIEEQVKKQNKEFEDYTLEELDEYWNQAKEL
jgi:tetrapyrrole methylase family protein/MazG family protein